MHPILSRPDRAWLIGPAGGAVGSMMGIVPLRAGGAAAGDAAWFSAWGILVMFAAMQGWQVARFIPLSRMSLGRVLIASLVAAAVFGAFWMGAAWATAFLLAGWLPSVEAAIAHGGAWMPLWASASSAFLCILFLMYALDASDQGEAAARRALESDVASRDAELRALRAQVDPHFLFNCLHSISSLTSRDAQGARTMCLELADFFRASLRAGAEARIPLSQELQLLRGYLKIEQVRFGDRLRASVDEAGESADVMVPPLLLQPLVENAVRHGIATLVEGGEVHVRVTRSAGRVEIVVDNAFDPDGRRPGAGVGLANVRDRLEAAYRGAAIMRVESVDTPSPLFTVFVSIPAEEQAAEERSGASGPPRATRPGGEQGSPPEIQ